jgi:phenylacetate-coenzyme A ligase PaaK-like adenylate-forming protein
MTNTGIKKLASICIKLLTPNDYREDLEHQLQALLLLETLKNARERSVFYKRYIKELPLTLEDPLDFLKTLPILTKEMAKEHMMDMLCVKEPPALVYHSTGLTGIPVTIFRSRNEIEMVLLFYKYVFSTIERSINRKRKPLILSSTSIHHGNVLKNPFEGYKLTLGETLEPDDDALFRTKNILLRKYDIPGVSNKVSIFGTSGHFIMLLTSYLLQSDFDFKNLAVKDLRVGIHYLSRRWKGIIEKSWNAKITNVYSLTEGTGAATECCNCGGLHFQPWILPEIVGLDGEPAENGKVGLLLITNLYPLCQMQPFIRYKTNDLFVALDNGCKLGKSYFFKGRLNNTLIYERDKKKEIAFAPVDLYEIVDVLPDCKRYTSVTNVPRSIDMELGGIPKYKAFLNSYKRKALVTLKIELTYNSKAYPDRCREIKDGVVKQLNKTAFPNISDGKVVEVHYNVEFCKPYTLFELPIKI